MPFTLRSKSTTPCLSIAPGNAQHQGNRDQQQDSFGFSDLDNLELLASGGALAVVADGMGGHALGREASQTAVSTLLSVYPQKVADEPIANALQRALQQTNAAVYNLARESGAENNAGTTLVAAVIHQNQLYWVSAGDSRIYLFRHRQLTLLTTDHVYSRQLQWAVEQGQLSAAEANMHQDRDSLTSFLGAEVLPEVDCNPSPFAVQAGDRILLCSDGLYRGLSQAEMSAALAQCDPQTAADELVTRVLAKNLPYQDNLTAVILSCADPDEVSVVAPRKRSWLSKFRWRVISIGLAIGLLSYMVGGRF